MNKKTRYYFITIMVKFTPTLSHYQKRIKKLKNIVIALLMTSKWSNILSNILNFNITAN